MTMMKKINGTIPILCIALNNIVISAAEAENGGTIIVSNYAQPINHTLDYIGFLQLATHINTNNSDDLGI